MFRWYPNVLMMIFSADIISNPRSSSDSDRPRPRSTKEEKPTLAGVSTKTRKRNIVIPVDPGSFANAVVQICQDAAEGLTGLDEELEAATKALDNANNLEFSRYSDTLFEVFFAGGMVGAGGKLAGEPGAPKLEHNVRVPHGPAVMRMGPNPARMGPMSCPRTVRGSVDCGSNGRLRQCKL